MIMIELQLEYLIAMKNAGGLSLYNPIERPMGSVTFGTQCLALARLEGPREMEEKIQECKSIKACIDKYGHNEKLKSDYMKTVQPCIDAVNETICNVEYASRKIKLGKIAEPEVINHHINNLRQVCDWVPEDILTCPSTSILLSQGAKEFMRKHVRKGTYKVEIFKDPTCDYVFCNLPSKSDVRHAGHIQYPRLQEDGSYSLPNEYLPVGSALEESECPSKSGEQRVGRYHPNKNRLNNSTTLGVITCYACDKDRLLYGSRHHVSKEQIE